MVRRRGGVEAVKAVVLVALVGCASQIDSGTEWIAADAITGALAPELGPPPAERAAGSTLRVVTWNVHFGKDIATTARHFLDSSDVVLADVVLVQEIEAHPSERVSRTQQLAEALGMSWFYAPARTEDGGGTHGIAILSRFPFERPEVRELPAFESSFRQRERNAMRVEVVVGTHRVQVVNLHLDVRLGAVDRIRQLDPAVDASLVGGDFNTNPWAWVQSTVPLTGTEAIVGQEQARVIDDYMFQQGFAGAITPETSTMRIPAFQIRTDDLYTRDGLTIVDSGVEFVDGSDHWPVWADIAF